MRHSSTFRPTIRLAVLALGAAAGGFAQTQKLAVIDVQSALTQTKDGQKAVGELRAKYSPKDQELQKRAEELQAKQQQYQKTQNTLSDEKKAAAEREIEALQRGIQRDSDDARQDMEQDQQKMLQDLGGKMMQVIQKYAADNQITMVFDVSQQPNNLLFASTAIDITRDIIGLYDKAAPAAPALGPATAAPAPRPATTPQTPSRPGTAPPGIAAPKPPATASPKPPPGL